MEIELDSVDQARKLVERSILVKYVSTVLTALESSLHQVHP